MSQHNYHPGLPVDFYAGLPVASTMTVTIPARQPVQDATTNKVISTYSRTGHQ